MEILAVGQNDVGVGMPQRYHDFVRDFQAGTSKD
jgi:hypothetical protein